MLLALLMLVARLLGSTAPVAHAAGSALTGSLVICHAGDTSTAQAPRPAYPAGHAHECRLCPACHLFGQATLPTPAAIHASMPAVTPARRHAPPPPSTGPPHPARLAAQPTGPPASA